MTDVSVVDCWSSEHSLPANYLHRQ